jgi:hypothetical protein
MVGNRLERHTCSVRESKQLYRGVYAQRVLQLIGKLCSNERWDIRIVPVVGSRAVKGTAARIHEEVAVLVHDERVEEALVGAQAAQANGSRRRARH